MSWDGCWSRLGGSFVEGVEEKHITLAKKGTLLHRSLASRSIPERAAVVKLFGVLGPRYMGREGGYTRVLKLSGRRRGDAADMSVIEFVGREGEIREAKEGGVKRRGGIGEAYEQFKKVRGKGKHPGLDWLW
ncbi:hypothetical protein TrRE_jg2732 [Triparma retinervis]|uniref:Ribosomal protein L17 n=1 Tax=Triparma retinervis TaxID=2557542 RepID=A0A9W7AAN2_9STRA|nr:hypothetical protein TrRE_jg2732 [Triparma retinervis]